MRRSGQQFVVDMKAVETERMVAPDEGGKWWHEERQGGG